MIKKILVANRGEIAQRIFSACRELGIPSVAIFSEADQGAPWVLAANESYPLKGMTAGETYLNQEAIFHVVNQSGADAIHPGYGFLSENPTFAAACDEQGIIFIGPSAEAMRMMGSKAAARNLAHDAGVPIVPGLDGAGKSKEELIASANEIGYPLLIKASAGGGGKGMRVVWAEDEFAGALQFARNEALSSFGDDHILIEKYFTEIHHIEIQILGDSQGNVVHLFERECSIQRRHQKIIEESPAPAIQSDDLRQEIASAAVRLAQASHYENAGTVEFIVDENGRFYFLEMNTRLQVEHPVTELVCGLDLAVWQIRVAAGEALPFSQEDLQQRGHAIECRLYAEDPAQNFIPSIGTITFFRPPSGPGIRVDTGITSGSEVTPYYDPMLAKIITWGRDRSEALDKMIVALEDTIVLGVTTNLNYLLAILRELHFRKGNTVTKYLEQHMADWPQQEMEDQDAWLAAAVFEMLQGGGKRLNGRVPDGGRHTKQPDPWLELDAWRNV